MDRTDEAARRTAINLMRLNEALDLKDIDFAPTRLTQAAQRRRNITNWYKRWFTSQAMRRIP